MLRPHVRMPLWAAVAIPAAAYLLRSALRASLRPDLPEDAVVLVVLVVALAFATRYGSAAQHRKSDLEREVGGGDSRESQRGENDEV